MVPVGEWWLAWPTDLLPASTLDSDMQGTHSMCSCGDDISWILNSLPFRNSPHVASITSTTTSSPTFRLTSSLSSTARAGAAGPIIPLDEVLAAGRTLTRAWERVNGCPNAEAH
ncbi:hypothetical protein F5B18DRAFT_641141 [Nemania serpens]|nr:hypothetical protein F5B18DRAFT_641141 [Nemania serpens]